ncbi:mitochondrial carrier [Athelia psychrophila]|uniref:Mitochondrial carrier n=1 Tax=Athelia psychrophila TaxID=1759441 RepID=A0A167WDS0_9AGAM|nr:mitochondrial carrier [Fibularhizoctonia sp. CBS 109695]
MTSLVNSNTKYFIAGSVGGIAGILVGQPLDTVKTRLQTPAIGHKYRSTFHALITIVKQENVRGLYKGVASPLASCALLNGLIFASYGLFLDLQLDDPKKPPTLWQVVFAGVATGVVASVITTPVELVKIRQQNELSNNPSVKIITSQLYKQHGIRGLYRGLTATMLRDTGYGAYFGSYEACCQLFAPVIAEHPASTPRSGPSGWGLLFAGGIAGIIGWAATFPMDVVKTRVQNTDWTPRILLDAESTRLVPSSLSPTSPGNPYRTTLSTIIYSYREEGISVFFRGLSTTVIRAIPVNIAIFAVFDFTVRVLS